MNNSWNASRALDRIFIAEHFAVPFRYRPDYMVAYWDKFDMPAVAPKNYSVDLLHYPGWNRRQALAGIHVVGQAMTGYIVRRILLMIPTILGVLTITFIIAQFVPGGPVEQVIAQMRHRNASGSISGNEIDPQQIEQIKRQFGFDKPPLTRYVLMLRDYSHFKLGRSFSYDKDVWEVIKSKLPVSISLGLWSTLLGYLISIPLGSPRQCARARSFDTITTMAVLVGFAIPGFVLGVLLIVLFVSGNFLEWFPLRGLVSDNWSELTWTAQDHRLFLAPDVAPDLPDHRQFRHADTADQEHLHRGDPQAIRAGCACQGTVAERCPVQARAAQRAATA